MNMTLRQLTLFKSVAEHLSFTRAAVEMCLTQPAVSIQIKQLEGHVGMPLFEQIGKRIFLTDAGRELYAACQDIFSRIETLDMSLNELQGSIKGRLKLAVVTTATYFTPHLFNRFLRQYPEVNIRLNVTNRNSILERLANNEDDLVIMGQVPEHLNVQSHQFLENPLVVLAPANHPLVNEKNIPISRILQETFLVRELGSGTRLAMERYFEGVELGLKVGMELGSSEAIKQGVIAGLGISVLSRHTLTLELATGIIKLLDVEGFPQMRYWYIVHLSEKKLSLVARTFLDFLITRTRDVLTEAEKTLIEAGMHIAETPPIIVTK
ncbi:LysR family transcriptional regulator [Beggiatoa leptomitoformis]|uniref:LysR family transcriptional regulator n=1 Tax=Beggiatoa leptomitoformis TaxID=288004 RepID=A0A2N9YG49_9GAMM|nr:LysR family transcriptional regulator [Beggiatoa leptomitoformis]ALG68152.1 LysR family transcriptional regulator [Beggiatoa leptomitoformis]AUI69551.1 LysR family transcriptional regulator [Beggiatoa leptomitoformis]